MTVNATSEGLHLSMGTNFSADRTCDPRSGVGNRGKLCLHTSNNSSEWLLILGAIKNPPFDAQRSTAPAEARGRADAR
jgi:hypothetical protein